MRKAWFLVTWRNDDGARLRQRVVNGSVEKTTYGFSQRFNEPQTCHRDESMGIQEIGIDEATTTLDLDFKVVTGADIMEALGL